MVSESDNNASSIFAGVEFKHSLAGAYMSVISFADGDKALVKLEDVVNRPARCG